MRAKHKLFPRLRFEWRESGGRPVGMPKRSGPEGLA